MHAHLMFAPASRHGFHRGTREASQAGPNAETREIPTPIAIPSKAFPK